MAVRSIGRRINRKAPFVEHDPFDRFYRYDDGGLSRSYGLSYHKAFALAIDIHRLTKGFPAEEKYELADQLRRSSRAVCRAIGEGYRKRQYPKLFSSKMSDADMENTETQVSLDLVKACGYLDERYYEDLIERSEEVGRILNFMIKNPDRFSSKN